ncbi:hypothetical protein ACJU26_08640 [Acidithiobacillus sp. M4-SHS-6]|uniref:hypothetical protein n=1 Tax=Acidithiobacillus sp. M4-SHS-6 TaxID=3383024 RepID=UPI0039BEB24E
MDVQETIEGLRRLIEGAIAPSIRDIQGRLDSLDKNGQEIREEIRDGNARHERLETRMDARMDRLDAKMDGLAERMDSRLDTLTSAILSMRQPTYPDAVLTRLEKLEREIEALRKQR